jgi:hypothetical protein
MATTAVKPIAITLPRSLHRYAEAQPEGPAEYLARLVREDHDRKRDALEAHLMKALTTKPIDLSEQELASGVNIPTLLRQKRGITT